MKFLRLLDTPPKILCRLVLPLLVIVFLLIVPNLTVRRMAFNSSIFDWGIRIVLTVWFCYNYWRMPEFFLQGKSLWANSLIRENQIFLKPYFIFATIIFSTSAFLFTSFAIAVFLPRFESSRLVISIVNGLLFMIAMLIQYNDFQEMINDQ